jgi:SanA protein
MFLLQAVELHLRFKVQQILFQMLPHLSVRKTILRIILLLSACCLFALYVSNQLIVKQAKGKLYSKTADIPYNKAGLLLGTSKWLKNGSINLFYKYRIDAAAELIHAGKIKYLIISGDNGRKDYNEPEMMRADLISAGVDSNRIYLDYAGFRTFDSVKRLKEIFGQQSVTIISQRFHNERALYIASRLGIAAIAYNAKDLSHAAGLKTNIREKFARVKVLFDFAAGVKPKYLGAAINIPE